MTEGSVPTTRFKAIEVTDGCTKRTPSSAAIEKLFQLRMALSVTCWMFRCFESTC